MAAVRKKQDDKILKSLRELATLATNKHCFDCGAKGVTYVNMTIGSFVCTSCSGILRGITPPHRVKSISMATFTDEEVDFLRGHGNEECAKTWLGLWDTKRALKMEHKDFMIEKYERKRYYLEPASPLKSIPSTTAQNGVKQSTSSSSASSTSSSRSATLDLKSISLTPPSTIQRQNGIHNHKRNINNNNNNFHESFPIDDPSSLFKQCKAATATTQQPQNGHSKSSNGGSQQITDFVADFSKATDLFGGQNNQQHHSNGGSNGMVNGSMNGGGGMMENFADFEHNQIYNAAGLSMNKSGGLVNGNKSSAPSADKYAALKDLDEQFREIKIIGKPDQAPSNGTQGVANPFKSNPFQAAAAATPSPWGVEPVTAAPPTQPKTTNGWTNGFTTQYNNNNNSVGYSTNTQNNNNNNGFFGSSLNGFPFSTMMPQIQNGTNSSFGGLNQPNGNYNPFMTGTVNSNNPFL